MTKRKAAPAALNTAGPAPTLPQRIRYFVGQLMQRAAQPGPDGEVDLELGGLAVALDMVAGDAERELAALTLQRDLAAAHDQQPYPTAWAYEQACKAARKHRDRAEAAEAAVARVRALAEGDYYYGITGRAFLAALDGPPPAPDDDTPLAACRVMETRTCPASYAGPCGDRPCARFESDDTPSLLEQTCATFSEHGWGRCVEPDGHEGNHAYRSPSKPTDGSPA